LTFVILQLFGYWTTPVARHIVVEPSVQFKPIKGNTLLAHPNLTDKRAHFCIELVSVHAEIIRRILQPDRTWLQNQISASG